MDGLKAMNLHHGVLGRRTYIKILEAVGEALRSVHESALDPFRASST